MTSFFGVFSTVNTIRERSRQCFAFIFFRPNRVTQEMVKKANEFRARRATVEADSVDEFAFFVKRLIICRVFNHMRAGLYQETDWMDLAHENLSVCKQTIFN